MNLNIILATCTQGLLWGILAIGVYITFRILNFADMTAEASLTLGGVVAVVLIVLEVNNFLAIVMAAISGAAAGFVTAFLHTKFKIQAILSGILTMIALYSVNLRIMGKANISLLKKGIFVDGTNEIYTIISIIFCIILITLIHMFFKTNLGLAVRATGDNEQMMRSQGANTNKKKIIALMISNAFCAVAGALIVQKQGYADINTGTGSIVIALASVVIGEAFIKKDSFLLKIISVVLGSIVYRFVVLAALNLKIVEPNDLKLFTAIIVAALLSFQNVRKKIVKRSSKNA